MKKIVSIAKIQHSPILDILLLVPILRCSGVQFLDHAFSHLKKVTETIYLMFKDPGFVKEKQILFLYLMEF